MGWFVGVAWLSSCQSEGDGEGDSDGDGDDRYSPSTNSLKNYDRHRSMRLPSQ